MPHTTRTGRPTLLQAEPLRAETFAPFGDVIESTTTPNAINQGMGERFADLATLELDAEGGRPTISRMRCQPETLPVDLRLMERHPLSSQAFVPVDGQRYIVVVAPAGDVPTADTLRAFVANGDQGINYRRGVWHHPMIALDRVCEFLEVHRAGPEANCDEVPLDATIVVDVPESLAGGDQ
ncbi:Ureidoglycolate hydrolase protein [Salinisphaera shabanensis E1L3A]|uniref:Ureidoglycolate hydrolase protein n=1 Tax=Salinisphaera shabanensis E1L3A TaxID=1033802 RepID=U2EPH2_9GAMM|nr:ureidoglycolate lyase [Salinisphaera shabanensis]ERJ19987.1 Ureidoglycolate hydrolase protein [Salinisphaera shabanensis E1L3A]